MRRASGGIFEELGFDPRQIRQPEGAVIYALARTYHLVLRRLAAIYQRFGLSAASFNLLLLLERGRQGPCSQRELCGRLLVSPSDMTGLVDRLERKGFVRRSAGPNRRTKQLRVTPAGARLLEQVWPEHAAEIERLVKLLSPAERTLLGRALERVRRAVA
jgi:MarR family 2-MHQ and catechol resistance regulon transcriptional repressor